jgi:hypothetical protein
MTGTRHCPPDADIAQALIHELLQPALWLFDVTTSLTDGCRAVIELAAAIRESVRDDLRAAAQLAQGKQMLL